MSICPTAIAAKKKEKKGKENNLSLWNGQLVSRVCLLFLTFDAKAICLVVNKDRSITSAMSGV